jgi:thiol-disulfide isomerase/thioredoxin
MGSSLLRFGCSETDSGCAFRTAFFGCFIVCNDTRRASNYFTIQVDFNNDRLSENGKNLVFFYAEWCPFCHSAFHHLSSLRSISYKVFRVDLSDEENLLWTSLNIRRIPTIIAFYNGKEFWRKEATYMIGLRKADFKEADSKMTAKVPE